MPTCSVRGCARKERARGLCGMHYTRVRRGGPVGEITPRKKPNGTYSRYFHGRKDAYRYQLSRGKVYSQEVMEIYKLYD